MSAGRCPAYAATRRNTRSIRSPSNAGAARGSLTLGVLVRPAGCQLLTSAPVLFPAGHRGQPGPEPTMLGHHSVVGIPGGDVAGGGGRIGQPGAGRPVPGRCSPPPAPRPWSGHGRRTGGPPRVPAAAGVDVNDLAGPVEDPVQAAPLAVDLHVGLVDRPGGSDHGPPAEPDPIGRAPADTINPAVVAATEEIGVDLSRSFPKPLADVVRATDVDIRWAAGTPARSSREARTFSIDWLSIDRFSPE